MNLKGIVTGSTCLCTLPIQGKSSNNIAALWSHMGMWETGSSYFCSLGGANFEAVRYYNWGPT